MPTGYEHWNEEADRIRYAETDFNSPMADMSDEDIKQAVYDREDDDCPSDWED
jgi:hypothetical protein